MRRTKWHIHLVHTYIHQGILEARSVTQSITVQENEGQGGKGIRDSAGQGTDPLSFYPVCFSS